MFDVCGCWFFSGFVGLVRGWWVRVSIWEFLGSCFNLGFFWVCVCLVGLFGDGMGMNFWVNKREFLGFFFNEYAVSFNLNSSCSMNSANNTVVSENKNISKEKKQRFPTVG